MHGACFDEPIDRVCLYLRVVQSGETFRLKRKRKLQKRIVSGLIALLIILTPLFTPITVRADFNSAPESVVTDVTNDTENETLNGGVAEEDSATPEDSALTDASEVNTSEENATSEENLAPEEKTSEEKSGAENGKEDTSETGSETGTEDTSENSSEEADALHTVTCEKTENAELSVYSSLKESDVEINPIYVRSEEEGLEVLEGYEISGKAEGVSEEVRTEEVSSEDKNETEETTEAIETVEDEEDVLAEAVEITEKEEATDTEEDSKEESSDDKEKASEETTEEKTTEEETAGEETINEESNTDGEIVETEEKLFVKAEVSEEVELNSRETVALYSVENNKAKDVIIEDISLASGPCEIDEDITGIALVKDTGYRHLNFEIFPEDGVLDKSVILDGLMPKEARAEAVDVTGTEDTVIAAYDITVFDGNNTYQPGDERPINVTIRDERITALDGIRLWHVKDDGSREEVTDFTVEDGQIRFDATGFSVYEIVDSTSAYLRKLIEKGEDGFYANFMAKDDGNGNLKGPYYFTGNMIAKVRQEGQTGLEVIGPSTTQPSNAVQLYFEHDAKSGTYNPKFYIYIKDTNGEKRYLRVFVKTGFADKRAGMDLVSQEERSLFSIDVVNNQLRIHSTINGAEYYWIRNKKDVVALVSYASETDPTIAWLTLPGLNDEDEGLDGKTYGLMNFTGGTHGYALMENSADGNVHSLVEIVTHQLINEQGESIESRTLYVDEGSEVTAWTFHKVGTDTYKLSAHGDNGDKYLAVQGDSLVVVNSADAATPFKTDINSNGKIQLSYQNKYVTFYLNDTETSSESGFNMASSSSANSWLNLLGFATLDDENLLNYSANRISISDAEDGQKVIVYTRIWNEETKRYDIYAVDYNGSLYKCYASGGKILWLGDGTGSLEWTFTEYRDAVSKEPNNYYELYNSYSEKYLVPQYISNQVLSETPVGINMPGRRNREFYSEIIAWDNSKYAYIGLKPNDEKTKLIPCSESSAVPFYFATLEELNLKARLHEVPTLNNAEHGITMKMFDFNGTAPGNNYVTNNYFGGDYSNKQGLLNTSLDYTEDSLGNKDAGYPTVSTNGKKFKDLYENAVDVNNLFIKSIYDSSGYFEFDSCQNFATFNGQNGGDFTVYRELGTTGEKTKATLQHGQFYPYNTIEAGVYSPTSPKNMYDMDALAGNDESGKLDETNPRKYEDLHLIKGTVDYYFGMEMSASFVQTVSGLDAWGHDIVFDFTGDDDFWFYVDGELVLDLGGTHSAEGGRVNFRTGEVTYDLVNSNNTARTKTTTTLKAIFEKNYRDRGLSETEIQAKLAEIFEDNGNGQYIFKDYTKHEMRVFYMERGAGASNLHLRFNIASVTPGHVSVSKTVEGPGAELLDKEFLEYPFQIYYTEEGEREKLLENDNQNIRVTYQNSNQPVTFIRRYRPPDFTEEEAYQNIYFINPTKKAEITFPDNTISYRIVECAVDENVYTVRINGEEVPPERVDSKHNLKSYSSTLGTSEEKPSISFENYVNDDVVKDLFITKILHDENGNEITDESATFNFRLSVSSVDVPAEDIPRAYLYKYYVLSPNKKVCEVDSATQKFTETTYEYDNEFRSKLNAGQLNIGVEDVTFRTSPFGAISGIPAGYTIVVLGLPVGTIFKVTEDDKPGYGLMNPGGYERIDGDKILEDGTVVDIPSYYQYDNNPLNVGKVRIEENPQMKVHNRKGYSLTVNKKWSDLNLTTSHDPVYVAVYVDGELLAGSVKEIKSPSTSAYYFWPALKEKSDGSEREDLTGYVVKEVKLTGSNKSVADEGTVSG